MSGFPEIVRRLPEAEAPFRGITLRLLQGPTACATFVEAMQDSEVPEHSHGTQWGVVVARGTRLDDRREDARPGAGRGVPGAGRRAAFGNAQSGRAGDRLLR